MERNHGDVTEMKCLRTVKNDMAASRQSEVTIHDNGQPPDHVNTNARSEIFYHDEFDNDDRSSPDTSGSTSSFTPHQCSRDEVKEIEKLIRTETKTVRFWRWVVIMAMMLVTAAVTTATYFFLNEQETTSFKTAFDQYANTLLSASRTSAETIRSTCSDYAAMVTASALRENAEWPFYTIPSWSFTAANLLRQTESFGIWISMNVNPDQRADWEAYALANSQEWYGNNSFSPAIFYVTQTGEFSYNWTRPGAYRPVWQVHPLPLAPVTNYDVSANPVGLTTVVNAVALGGYVGTFLDTTVFESLFPSIEETRPKGPYSSYYSPIFDSFNEATRRAVATLQLFVRWGLIFAGKLPNGVQGIHLVLENTCNQAATWELVGREAIFLNTSDLHDKSFDRYKHSSEFNTYENPQLAKKLGVCLYTLSVYPSSTFEDEYRSTTPIIVTCIVGVVLLSMVGAFLAYDNFQLKRTTKVVINAAKSNALVTSLFPRNILDRLLPADNGLNNRNMKNYSATHTSGIFKLSENMSDPQDETRKLTAEDDNPIADLFLETTIIFADITGFTAWSSERQPSQVFTLLETVFSALDRIAQKRRVFKVETVGDCYVAVAGLPEPRKDHAVAMTRFAHDTIRTVHDVVKRLEVTLGPDTGDLGVRIGLHSGVVTAGVLRGERARFQLFGDTVNTTARIESTGARNRIHASKDTADLLIAAGKKQWVRPREDLISAKGKGSMQTFWIDLNNDNSSASRPNEAFEPKAKDEVLADANLWADAQVVESKMERLIDWQVDVFSRLLKQVVARRNACAKLSKNNELSSALRYDETKIKRLNYGTCLDEVKEIICLPDFEDHAVSAVQENPNEIALDQAVVKQLRMYIGAVAKMYRRNAFHNFEHACHVTMSVTKLLSRIVKPSDLLDTDMTGNVLAAAAYSDNMPRNTVTATGVDTTHKRTIESTLHERSYGITSDPLTQFSIVFSALIHDVDHTGVPNATLITENAELARTFHNKSVAEQNSVQLAWNLLEDDQYRDLRSCIYKTNSEYDRCRQLVVQTVLATDIVDQELKVLRNARWDRAFQEKAWEESQRDTRNRKATIVIEHLIQASDVAHTMQHWHVYRKWNENFFRECYKAYKDGRAENDPSIGWYKGELGFFDFYIIPLAKKLKKCGVFGVSSDEYLNYAIANRQEWEDRGQEVVEEMCQAIYQEQQQHEQLNGSLFRSPVVGGTCEDEKSQGECFMDDGLSCV